MLEEYSDRVEYLLQITYRFTVYMLVGVSFFLQFSEFNSFNSDNAVLANNMYKGYIAIFILLQLSIFLFGRKSIVSLLIAIFILGFFGLSLLSPYKIIDNRLLIVILCCLNAQYGQSDTFIKNMFKISMISFIIILIFSILQLFPVSNVVSWNRPDGTVRNTFGFMHPNTTGGVVLSLYFSYLLSKKNKVISYFELAVLIISFVIVSKLTDSRGFEVAGAILIFVLIMYKIGINLKPSIIKWATLAISLLIPIVSIYSVYNYNPANSKWLQLNNLLSGRIMFQQIAVKNLFPIKLWGQSTNIMNNMGSYSYLNGFSIDNQYIYLLITSGIVGFTLFEIFYFITIVRVMRSNDVLLCTIFLCLSVLSIIEAEIITVYFVLPYVCAYFKNYSSITLYRNKLLYTMP